MYRSTRVILLLLIISFCKHIFAQRYYSYKSFIHTFLSKQIRNHSSRVVRMLRTAHFCCADNTKLFRSVLEKSFFVLRSIVFPNARKKTTHNYSSKNGFKFCVGRLQLFSRNKNNNGARSSSFNQFSIKVSHTDLILFST